MTRAIADGATDMIGLARPLTAEPRICADLLAGRASEARPNLVAEAWQVAASIRLIPMIARSEPLPDLSDEDTARAWEAALRSNEASPAAKEREAAQGTYKSQL
jgi:hypothetical protein